MVDSLRTIFRWACWLKRCSIGPPFAGNDASWDSLASSAVVSRRASCTTSPSLVTRSRLRTHGRMEPARTLRAPAALVATIPPIVQKVPLAGFGASRSPSGSALLSSAPQVTAAPTSAVSSGEMRSGESNSWRSRMMPCPTLPPAMPLPAPRGTRGQPRSALNRTRRTTSSQSAGIATALGRMR